VIIGGYFIDGYFIGDYSIGGYCVMLVCMASYMKVDSGHANHAFRVNVHA